MNFTFMEGVERSLRWISFRVNENKPALTVKAGILISVRNWYKYGIFYSIYLFIPFSVNFAVTKVSRTDKFGF